MNFIEQNKSNFEDTIENFKEEIASLRTGRANPKMVENVDVEAYGNTQELKTLASISTEDAKTLLVEPYDENVVQDIESALHEADININPVTDGKKIRLPLPELTSERRQELIDVLNEKAEEAKINIRKIRGEIKDEIELAEEEGEITEDERYRKIDELDDTVEEYNQQVEEIKEKKKKNIEKV
ncbi:MAG: ribosome recycling factor [Candidatus Magasanikbacteria bacterium]